LVSWHLFFHDWCTNKLTTRTRVLGKLIRTQLVNEFPAFYGTRRFITVFTGARHWPYTEPDESNPQSHILFVLRSNLISIFPFEIYTWVSHVVSSLKVSRTKFCIHFLSPHACFMLHPFTDDKFCREFYKFFVLVGLIIIFLCGNSNLIEVHLKYCRTKFGSHCRARKHRPSFIHAVIA
jgi:hypothetical protein